MSQDIRRELISKNLGIKPISHGQVHTFQIALPELRKKQVSFEKRQAIEKSLLSHQSNLVSLIIRRTDAYDDEDIEYELVYGADWLQAAQSLNIEKVWAWVFDMTDEQVVDAIIEMEALSELTTGSSGGSVDSDPKLDKKLLLATDSIKNSLTQTLNGIKSELDERLKVLNYRIDDLSASNFDAESFSQLLSKLESIEQKIGQGSVPLAIPDPINLLEASDRDIEIALKKVRTNKTQIEAAIAVVNYWKKSNQGLSWGNIELSSRSSNRVKGFGQKTYERLRMVGQIPGQDETD